MKRSQFVLLTGLAGLIAVAGCGKVNSPAMNSATDQAAASAALANAPDLIDDGQLEDATQTGVSALKTLPGDAAAIAPRNYWRTITSVQREFSFAFSDTDSTGHPRRAEVTVMKTLTGTFNVIDSTHTTYHKALLDHWTRHLELRRVRIPIGAGSDSTTLAWHVAATSGVSVVSDQPPADHVHIVSVRVQAGTLDTTVTDPTALFRLRRVLPLLADSAFTITVTTTHANDVVILQHNRLRWRLHANGDGTYTGTGTVPSLDGTGIRHFAINALGHETLFDDTAAYDSDAWVFPFCWRGETISDYR